MTDIFDIEPEAELHAQSRQNNETRDRLAVQMLKKVRDSLTHVIQLLEEGDTTRATRQLVDLVTQNASINRELESKTGSCVLEGVFDGMAMVGPDGHRYVVPENYASKSRLVEGDMLKLTIQPNGHQVFKQIGPVQRQRLVGQLLVEPSTQEHIVTCQDQVYKVLAASVSYFRAAPGDQVVILVPREGQSCWAAVERLHTPHE